MRVIGGEFRSRKLKTVDSRSVRPTPDRLRESLFSILTPQLPGKLFVDAYAGSGAVGIEAFSRGAHEVILIERNPDAIAVIRENLASLGVRKGVTVARGAAAKLLSKYKCDIAFVDPPYDQANEYDESMLVLAAQECPLVIAQHESRWVMPEEYGGLKKVRVLKQGDNSLSFYEQLIKKEIK